MVIGPGVVISNLSQLGVIVSRFPASEKKPNNSSSFLGNIKDVSNLNVCIYYDPELFKVIILLMETPQSSQVDVSFLYIFLLKEVLSKCL